MPSLNYFDKDKQEWVAIPLGGGGDSVITAHDGAIPEPTTDTPQGLEDAFSGLDDGLHYYKDVGSLVAITRQEYQTTITLTGQLSSFAKVVKSESGLSTPENPSLIVMQTAEGQWLKLTSDDLDESFGNPKRVDIFSLTGGTADLSNYYTKPEVDSALTSYQQSFLTTGDLNQTNNQIQALATVTQGVMDKVDTKADQSEFAAFQGQYGTLEAEFREYFRLLNQGFATVAQKADVDAALENLEVSLESLKADTYTKPEVDAKLEADKDFSIANDNVLLASITSLQEIVSNLGTDIGTGQVDVLDAIRGVEIEPSMITLSGDTASPIAWKGNLSLTPVKEGDHWRLNWNDGKAIHTLLHADEFSQANIVLLLDGQEVSVANLKAGGFELSELAMGAAGDRLITQVEGGPENTVAYLSDLSGYAPTSTTTLITTQLQAVFDSIYTRAESDDRYAAKSDNTQNLLAKTVVAQAVGFGGSAQPPVALAYTDSGEGYGDRLVLNMGLTNEYLVYKSDLDSVFPVIDTSQFATTVTAAALDTRIKSLESKSAATSNINDATNAALKKSILDAVALMIAGGGKQPPADIDWTPCRNFGSSTNHPTAQARMIGGVIELRGTLSFPSGTTGDQSFCRLPAGFPFAEFTASVPAAARVTSGSVAVAAYVTFSSLSANLGFDTASRANEVFLTGIKIKAAY